MIATLQKSRHAVFQMREALEQVIPVFDRQSDHRKAQRRFRAPKVLEPIQVGFHRLRAPPNGAERAKQMTFAEVGSREPNAINCEVVTEEQERTAPINRAYEILELLSEMRISFGLVKLHEIRYISKSTGLCFPVAF
jgi:hypothetical protein